MWFTGSRLSLLRREREWESKAQAITARTCRLFPSTEGWAGTQLQELSMKREGVRFILTYCTLQLAGVR